jgi:hypothetical protein
MKHAKLSLSKMIDTFALGYRTYGNNSMGNKKASDNTLDCE